ncbi:MAG: divalent-cation tolerance protein CutA [candidate division KSB1 bacterium]|nr:divalent-cation tolerance protein CutA [candidate division KSB1 bacterium]MDZ7334597.1 divalent-cation tolerance protein CutA [candidate division KSB1 bacterium]MDZ7356596.1 divalent-cation tolerance protein CutA [candidate division KSB1 bacterium]MDZ7375728.1 divalent-cation tolerance protein CutA [candidate division KSB1 bacterium]MDZ7399913.1 divalent-cation tolerance protein CutA [candidate division KSB1 bacterium]
MKGDFIVVFVTAGNRQEAELIGRALVEKKLAACCNIVESIQSIFYWEGKLNQEREALLIIKSVRDRFDRIVSEVKQLHSYTTPEIIALPIVAGASDYLDWIIAETKSRADESLV